MQKRTREILALVLLGVLAVIGVSALAWYILVGHNWNVTASNIDDSIGQMEGYTVLVYAGTQPLAADPQESSSSSASPSTSASGSESSRSAVGDQAPAEGSSSSAGDVPAVEVEDVMKSYRDKGAAVFSVDVSDASKYGKPSVVKRFGKKLGLLFVEKTASVSSTRLSVASLERRDVDYTVVVTDDTRLYRVADRDLIGSVSVIICDDSRGKAPNDEYHGSTYCVNTPHVGEVGVVVISPSGVFSSKVIRDLSES